jgi:hypothetical protein
MIVLVTGQMVKNLWTLDFGLWFLVFGFWFLVFDLGFDQLVGDSQLSKH